MGDVRLISVRQHDLAHHQALLVFQLAGFEIHHGKACDVAGRDVWRELNALERTIQRTRQRAGQRGFAHAGHVFDQHVPFAQDGVEHQFNGGFLADHNLADVAGERLCDALRSLHVFSPLAIGFHGRAARYCICRARSVSGECAQMIL